MRLFNACQCVWYWTKVLLLQFKAVPSINLSNIKIKILRKAKNQTRDKWVRSENNLHLSYAVPFCSTFKVLRTSNHNSKNRSCKWTFTIELNHLQQKRWNRLRWRNRMMIDFSKKYISRKFLVSARINFFLFITLFVFQTFLEKNFKSKKKHFLHHFFDRSFLGLFGNCVKDLSLEEQRNY